MEKYNMTDQGHDDTPRGLRRWLMSTNHKDIGTMYIIFAIIAGLIGGLFSVLFRLQLAYPGSNFLGGDHQFYNVLITAHALIMVFFMIMPALLVDLVIGLFHC